MDNKIRLCLQQAVLGGGWRLLDDGSPSMACLSVVSGNFGNRARACVGMQMLSA